MNQQILENIKSVGRQVLPANGKLWLYGSQAREEAGNHSDWDLLILLDKDKIDETDYDEYAFPLNQIGWTLDADISPILYTKKEWEANAATLFHHNVERDKIELL